MICKLISTCIIVAEIRKGCNCQIGKSIAIDGLENRREYRRGELRIPGERDHKSVKIELGTLFGEYCC